MFSILLYLSARYLPEIFGVFFWETKNVMHYAVLKDLFRLHRQGKGMWREGEGEDFTHCKFLRFLWAHLDNKGIEVSLSVVNSIRLPTAILRWLLLSSIPWLFFVDVSWFPTTAFWINNYKFSGGSREKDAILLVKAFKLHLGRPRLEALNQQIFNYFIYSGMTATKKYEKDQLQSTNTAWW